MTLEVSEELVVVQGKVSAMARNEGGQIDNSVMYRVSQESSDWVLLTCISSVPLRLPDSAWAERNLAEAAGHDGGTQKSVNPIQVSAPLGHPVQLYAHLHFQVGN